MYQCSYTRRGKGKISLLSKNILCLRSPWISAWCSASFPGFGHFLIGQYMTGLILVIWEIFINTQANLNTAIIFTFIGEFDKAKAAINSNWAILYAGVYIYTVWDSYRSTVELNKYVILADAEDKTVIPSTVTSIGINYSDKIHPWLAVFWSAAAPGFGLIYAGNVFTSVLIMIVWIIIAYMSHLIAAVQFTCTGDFINAKSVVNPEWLLFLPSIYIFNLYGTYVSVNEYNNYFDAEQARYLETHYQNPHFNLPLKLVSTQKEHR